jgi:hypothetical protein
MQPNGNTLDAIIREWARAQIQLLDIRNYNGAAMTYIDKANMANQLGLSEQQKIGVTPFPSPQTRSLAITAPTEAVNQPAPVSQYGTGGEFPPEIDRKAKTPWLPIIGASLLSAVLAAGGTGAAVYALGDKKEPETKEVEETPKEDVEKKKVVKKTPTDGRVGVDVIGWPKKQME